MSSEIKPWKLPSSAQSSVITGKELTGKSESASLSSFQQYLSKILKQQQQSSEKQTKVLSQIAKREALATIGILETEKSVRTQTRISEIRFALFIGFWIGIIIYALGIYISITERYDLMIKKVDSIPSPAWNPANPRSGFSIALAYEYPGIFGELLYGGATENFPSAVIYGFYTTEFSKFLTGDPARYVPRLYNQAQLGTIKGTSTKSAIQLLCIVVGIPNNIAECVEIDPCQGPTRNNVVDYLSAGSGLAFQGAFLGTEIGGPGIGTGIGAIVGAGVGIGLKLLREFSASEKCKKDNSKGKCITGTNQACNV
jgi:hypothetical protein